MKPFAGMYFSPFRAFGVKIIGLMGGMKGVLSCAFFFYYYFTMKRSLFFYYLDPRQFMQRLLKVFSTNA